LCRRRRRRNNAKTCTGTAKLRPSFQLFEVASPRVLPCLSADEASNIYPFRLLICRVFFFCCDSAASPQVTVWAPAWAPRLSTCDAQRVAPRATASAPRSSTCDTQGTSPREAASAPRSIIWDKLLPRATACPPRPSTCVVPRVPDVCARSK
jgi:hypothetical protein